MELLRHVDLFIKDIADLIHLLNGTPLFVKAEGRIRTCYILGQTYRMHKKWKKSSAAGTGSTARTTVPSVTVPETTVGTERTERAIQWTLATTDSSTITSLAPSHPKEASFSSGIQITSLEIYVTDQTRICPLTHIFPKIIWESYYNLP